MPIATTQYHARLAVAHRSDVPVVSTGHHGGVSGLHNREWTALSLALSVPLESVSCGIVHVMISLFMGHDDRPQNISLRRPYYNYRPRPSE